MAMGSVMIVVMGVMMLGMIGGVAWGAVSAMRRRRKAARGASELLDRRYAAGELTTEEYDERRRAIERDSS